MRFAVLLFILILTACFFAAFMPQETADALVYSSLWFQLLLALLFLSTFFCVLKRLSTVKDRKKLKIAAPSLLFHGGVCVIALGAICTLLFAKSGTMYLGEGQSISAVILENKSEWQLPFTLKLERFDVEYSSEENHYIIVKNDKTGIQGAYRLDGAESFTLLAGDKTYSAAEPVFEPKRLKLKLDGNPFVLEEAAAVKIDDGYELLYVSQNIPTALSYASFLEFQQGEKIQKAKTDINNPAYFGAYTVYQVGYADDGGPVSVLSVKTDWGKYITLFGALLLCAGLLLRLIRTEKEIP